VECLEFQKEGTSCLPKFKSRSTLIPVNMKVMIIFNWITAPLVNL